MTQIVEAVAANSGGLEGAGESLAYATFVEVTTLRIHEYQIVDLAPFVLKGLSLTLAIESATTWPLRVIMCRASIS